MSAASAPRATLVHDWLTGMRGGEKVLEALAALYPDAPIHTLLHRRGQVSAALERHPIHTSFVQRLPGALKNHRRYLPLFPSAIEDFDLGAFDLVISSSHCVAKGVVPRPDAFHICYCHSPMRYAWDQEHVYFPRRRGIAARLRNVALTALRGWDVASAPRVDLFVANSRFVAERVRRYYGRTAEVVAPPVDVARFAEDTGPDDTLIPHHERQPRCLMVSALAPYKRVDVAIAACAQAGIALDVVGDGPERRRLERLADPSCRLHGWVDGPQLRQLYRRARYFVQPGVEDFGIAAVESLASGTPVIARGRGGVLDIVHDGVHGTLYNGDVAAEQAATALAQAIDKSQQLRFNSLELQNRAHVFSLQVFTSRMRALIERGLADRRSGLDDPEA